MKVKTNLIHEMSFDEHEIVTLKAILSSYIIRNNEFIDDDDVGECITFAAKLRDQLRSSK